MQLIRSFPEVIPEGRNYVVDDAPRLYNVGQDYRGLRDLADDVIHLDWDTAVSREQLQEFATRARKQPSRVLVAPVLIYPSPARRGLQAPVWNVRRYTPGNQATRYCLPNVDDVCNLFGFGMVYLPGALVEAFCSILGSPAAPRFGDIEFAQWHYLYVRPNVDITWDLAPTHLHYRISEVPL